MTLKKILIAFELPLVTRPYLKSNHRPTINDNLLYFFYNHYTVQHFVLKWIVAFQKAIGEAMSHRLRVTQGHKTSRVFIKSCPMCYNLPPRPQRL